MPGQNTTTNRRQRVAEACSNCKRRKEKCNGSKPCARCIQRRVEHECEFRIRTSEDTCNNQRMNTLEAETLRSDEMLNECLKDATDNSLGGSSQLTQTFNHLSPPSIAQQPRVIQGAKGKHMFVGDSANISFLEDMRRVVENAIGPCSFTEDPLRHHMVEHVPDGQPNWLHAQLPPSIDQPTAFYLVKNFFRATHIVLDLFDEDDLLVHIPMWTDLQRPAGCILSTIYYLVLAIGAQTAPHGKDELAQACFDYGRYLTALNVMEDPSIATIQTYSLITIYLLGASRGNGAFMYLGTAVRAAHALGIHRSDVSALFTPEEFQTRERLWRVIRTLDLHMSALFGRPPSTSETRDTEAEIDYSASNDLCAIFENILNDIYAKRMVSVDVVEKISAHHRRWTTRFHRGIAVDMVRTGGQFNDKDTTDLGMLHVKAAYYWTIILLTRPFLMDTVSSLVNDLPPRSRVVRQKSALSHPNKLLTHACVDSATRTIDLLKELFELPDVPRRLPLMVNNIYVSALILGIAHFADLYKVFPLRPSFATARKLLALFPDEVVARRYTNVLEYLDNACQTYLKLRAKENMDRNAELLGGIFGQIHLAMPTSSVNHPDEVDMLDQAAHNVANDDSMGTVSGRQNFEDGGGFDSIVLGSPTARNRDVFVTSAETMNTDWFMQKASGMEANTDELMSSEFDHVGNGAVEALQKEHLPSFMSPHTLHFKPYKEGVPFFTTVNAQGLDLSHSGVEQDTDKDWAQPSSRS